MRNNWDNKGQMLSIGPSTLVTSVKITMTGIVAIVALEIVGKGGQMFKLVIRVLQYCIDFAIHQHESTTGVQENSSRKVE